MRCDALANAAIPMTPAPPPGIPDARERARLNAATAAETGFWDERGNPAPWPDDIHDWTPDTNQPQPGSGPLSVIELAPAVSSGEQDPFAQEIEFGAAVHLALDHFDAVDVAFDGA
jgi:hypothetical protein